VVVRGSEAYLGSFGSAPGGAQRTSESMGKKKFQTPPDPRPADRGGSEVALRTPGSARAASVPNYVTDG